MKLAQAVALVVMSGLPLGSAFAQPGPPPPLGNPPSPAGNPITEPKRLLGKILFWDEQFSASGTVSCGTCHTPEAGGGDLRRVRHPGPDNALNTPDDIFGSPGVVDADGLNEFERSGSFAFASQVTSRVSPSAFMGAFFTTNFWDGRAGPAFVSPTTGQTVLNAGAALESQAVEPPLSDVEMAHDSRTWGQISEKLRFSTPLAFVDQVPSDLAGALADGPSYPLLFQRAFGSGEITAERIAMAIAVYERTLVPNQTPWDAFAGGQANALTAQQQQGLNIFTSNAARCAVCHGGNTFSDNQFHNIGLRPVAEDRGRQNVTNNPNDRGRFKTPSLRNVGLKNSFFHNGQVTTLENVVRFYVQAPGSPPRFADNLDPVVQGIAVNPQQLTLLVDFLRNGLTDPRVVNSQPPFDKPRIWSRRADLREQVVAAGTPAAGSGVVPLTIACDPPVIGTGAYRVGLGLATAGRNAVLRVSTTAPLGGVLGGGFTVAPELVKSDGGATVTIDLAPGVVVPLQPVYLQWDVLSVDGASVAARSDVVRIVPFCPSGGCPSPCPADIGTQGGLAGIDGVLDNNDFIAFIDLFFSRSSRADLGRQGGVAGPDALWNNDDFIVFVDLFFGGC